MEHRYTARRIAVFGLFTFDFSSLELRRNGVKLRLEDKPAKVLAILINRAGTVVSREDLCKALWPDEVHIDFDHGLNKSVNKLRGALDDASAEPRFIETLSRRGYRFIGRAEFESDALVPEDGNQKIESAPAAGSLSFDIPALISSSPRADWKMPSIIALSVVLLATAGYFGWMRIAGHSIFLPVDHARIAVLPFTNLTGNPDQDYICDGLTEEMIAQLSIVGSPHLAVIARTSVMHYKGSPKTAKEIAQELGADFILESSVRLANGHLRITTQLIDARTDTHMWAKSFDRDLSDVLGMHRAVALSIARQIQLQISPGALASQMSQGVSPQAHEAYLRGRYAWNQRSIPSLHSAVDFFNQAIALVPTYAEAYSGLADAQALLASTGGAPYREAYPIAESMARKALALNPSLPEAHTSLAFVEAFYDWKFTDAESEFRRAIALDASYVTAHHWFGMYLSETGHHAEGIAELELARQLDPLSLVIGLDLADAYARARDDSKANALYLKMREIDDRIPQTFIGVALLHAREHKFAEAEAENKLNRERFGPHAGIEDELIFEYVRAGDSQRAEAIFSRMEREAKKRGTPCENIAASCVIFGHKEDTMKILEAGFKAHADWMVELKSNPMLVSLHSNAHFQDLLSRIGFSE